MPEGRRCSVIFLIFDFEVAMFCRQKLTKISCYIDHILQYLQSQSYDLCTYNFLFFLSSVSLMVLLDGWRVGWWRRQLEVRGGQFPGLVEEGRGEAEDGEWCGGSAEQATEV